MLPASGLSSGESFHPLPRACIGATLPMCCLFSVPTNHLGKDLIWFCWGLGCLEGVPDQGPAFLPLGQLGSHS